MQNLIWCLQNLVSPFSSSASFSSSSLPNPLQDFCQRFRERAVRKINTTKLKIKKKKSILIWKSNSSSNVNKRLGKEEGNWENWWKTSCKCFPICFILRPLHIQAFPHSFVKLWHYITASALLQAITWHTHQTTKFNSWEELRKVQELGKVTSWEIQ